MKNIDVIKYKIYIFTFTFCLILSSFAIILFVPLNKSIEFVGGTVFEVDILNKDNISKLYTTIPQGKITHLSGERYFVKLSHNTSYDINSVKDNLSKISIIQSSSTISPVITGSLVKKSFFAVIFSLLTVFIYILLRFNSYYSLGALLTIIHDVVVVIAFIKILHIDFGITIIAAILTIIGYSINDTVIIYDKIRSSLTPTSDFITTLNHSISSTIPRTIGTSITTLLAIIPVILFANGDIRSFCVIVFFGVAVGTFSSIAVSALTLMPFKGKIIDILKLRQSIKRL